MSIVPLNYQNLTIVCRIAEESINDANDRAIVTAAAYFQNILTETSSGEVVFITNDVANKVTPYSACKVAAFNEKLTKHCNPSATRAGPRFEEHEHAKVCERLCD